MSNGGGASDEGFRFSAEVEGVVGVGWRGGRYRGRGGSLLFGVTESRIAKGLAILALRVAEIGYAPSVRVN